MHLPTDMSPINSFRSARSRSLCFAFIFVFLFIYLNQHLATRVAVTIEQFDPARAQIPPDVVPPVPLQPTLDPWYEAPSGWQNAAPGDLLRQRSAPAIAFRLTQNRVENGGASHIMYRTTDSFDEPAVSVVTVIRPAPYPSRSTDEPPSPEPVSANASRLLMYQPPYDSASSDCAPSYQFALENATNPMEPSYQIVWEETIIQALLSRGYHVAISDYETLSASFTVGPTEGRAVLDAVHVVLAHTDLTGVSPDARVQLLGYSGGAAATEWASELQARYKPALSEQIIGVVAGGLPANSSAAIDLMNRTKQAGLIPKGLVGIANGNASFASALDGALKPDAALREEFFSVRNCGAQYEFEGQDIWAKYFVDGDAFRHSHLFTELMKTYGLMGQGVAPRHATYFFQGCRDEVVGVGGANALVEGYCGAGGEEDTATGVSITYETLREEGHVFAALKGLSSSSNALRYIVDRFEGVPAPRGCTIVDTCEIRAFE